MKLKHNFLDPGLHVLAIAQARAHAEAARLLARQFAPTGNVAVCLVYLVNASFSIELYFKALMLAGRGGQVARTHDLAALLGEFPEFLKHRLRKEYAKILQAPFGPVLVIGLIQSEAQPSMPAKSKLDNDFRDFDSAIFGISNSFVRARYLFDEVGSDEYAYIDVPVEPIEALGRSLDIAYRAFIAGEFKGQASAVSSDA